jgi:pilus assembly protein Flp/PilA
MLESLMQTAVRMQVALSLLRTRMTREEGGATMVEYALIVAVIAVVVAGVATLLGTNVKAVFTKVNTCVSGPSTANCP